MKVLKETLHFILQGNARRLIDKRFDGKTKCIISD